MIRRLPPSLVLALTQVVVEGAAFLRNLVLARLIGADDMGLAVAIAIGVRVFEMFGDFEKGQLVSKNVAYFLSLTIVSLFLAVRVLEMRRQV